MKIAFILSLFLVACGSGVVRMDRQVRDEKGNVVSSVTVTQNNATVSDTEKLFKSAREYEESARGGDIASQGIQRGLPVSLNTQGSQVTAGYVQSPYGYNGSSGFSSAYDPLIAAERATLGNQPYGQLPPLTQYAPAPPPVYGQPQQLPTLTGDGKEACPPNGKGRTDGERLTCSENALKSMADILIK